MNKTITASIALVIALMSAQPFAAPVNAMCDQGTAAPVEQERNFYEIDENTRDFSREMNRLRTRRVF